MTTTRATMTTTTTTTTYPDVPSHRGLEREIIDAGRALGGGGDETTTSLRRRGRGRRPRTIVETSSTTVGIGRAANGGVWGGDGRSGRRTTDVVSRAPPGTHCDDDAAAMTRDVRGTAVLLVVDEGGGGIDGDRAHGEGMAVRRPSRDRRRVGTRTTIDRATGGERRGRGI
jgi:hypothetical protein